jgi:23S rRNA pseudoU1915 N3-methylase RlmH
MSRLCCEYCGKEYKRRINHDKHVILCEIIYKARKKDKRIDRETEEINEEIPTQKQMYKILQELALKYNKLEEKIELMSKWVDKKKKKINVLDWLNTSSGLKPELIFDNLADSISILESDINLLFNGNFYDMLNEIFVRNIYDKNESEVSLFAFIQKTNTIYIYSKQNTVSETSWIELSRENLIYFLNKVHYKIVKVLIEWNKKNRENPNFSEKMEEMYNKSNIKLMGIDFKHEPVLSKIKFNIYNKMKKDMKALIEYEFEF